MKRTSLTRPSKSPSFHSFNLLFSDSVWSLALEFLLCFCNNNNGIIMKALITILWSWLSFTHLSIKWVSSFIYSLPTLREGSRGKARNFWKVAQSLQKFLPKKISGCGTAKTVNLLAAELFSQTNSWRHNTLHRVINTGLDSFSQN